MKIIAGEFKGRNFYMPEGIRPTQSLVRKSFFDFLGPDVGDMNFLDLFAGSGAVGLEALSRGVKACVMVENNPKCVDVIHDNLERFSAAAEVLAIDSFAALKLLERHKRKFDVVFCDPPYQRAPRPQPGEPQEFGRDKLSSTSCSQLARKALKQISACDILAPNSFLIIQHSRYENLPDQQGRFVLFRVKKFGNTLLSYYSENV